MLKPIAPQRKYVNNFVGVRPSSKTSSIFFFTSSPTITLSYSSGSECSDTDTYVTKGIETWLDGYFHSTWLLSPSENTFKVKLEDSKVTVFSSISILYILLLSIIGLIMIFSASSITAVLRYGYSDYFYLSITKSINIGSHITLREITVNTHIFLTIVIRNRYH